MQLILHEKVQVDYTNMGYYELPQKGLFTFEKFSDLMLSRAWLLSVITNPDE